MNNPEPVQIRITGTPEAVARTAELLTAADGIIPGPVGTKNRTPRLTQGYLTAVVDMHDTRPVAELSTDQQRDGAHQPGEQKPATDPEIIRELIPECLAREPLLGYSTLPLRNPVDIAAILHRQGTRPAAELSTDQQQDGATRQTPEEIR